MTTKSPSEIVRRRIARPDNGKQHDNRSSRSQHEKTERHGAVSDSGKSDRYTAKRGVHRVCEYADGHQTDRGGAENSDHPIKTTQERKPDYPRRREEPTSRPSNSAF